MTPPPISERGPACPGCAREGFTLVELLVAAALTMALGVLLLTVAQGVISGFIRTQGNTVRQGDLSFTLDQLVLDLEGLVIPNAAGSEGLRVSFETVDGSWKVPWLTLLSAAVDSDNSEPVQVDGATRSVSYRMAKQRPIEGDASVPESYGIYRSISSAAHTFKNALNLGNLQADYWQNLPATPSPSPYPSTDTGNLLCENVVNFSVLFQYADNAGNLVWTKPDDTISIRRDGTFINGSSSPVTGGFLRAQVSVTALSPEGAKRVQDGVLSLEDAISRYGTTVVRQTAFF